MVYFISDAHFGVESAQKETRKRETLASFLHTIRNDAESLYVLGDLFDFWFEYKTVIPRDFYNIISGFHDLIRDGVNVSYICGNHDFWQRGFLEEEVGMKIYRYSLEQKIYGKKIFLAHGDGLTPDTGYILLKSILRNRFNISLYSMLHPDVGIGLARLASKLSRRNSNKKHKRDTLLNFADSKFEEGFDYVILAHTHKPTFYRKGGKVYMNIGDWMENFSYGKLWKDGVSLKFFHSGRVK